MRRPSSWRPQTARMASRRGAGTSIISCAGKLIERLAGNGCPAGVGDEFSAIERSAGEYRHQHRAAQVRRADCGKPNREGRGITLALAEFGRQPACHRYIGHVAFIDRPAIDPLKIGGDYGVLLESEAKIKNILPVEHPLSHLAGLFRRRPDKPHY